ncbi:aminotransferase class V-fold PLP-dependent enzyme [Sphingomonas sp. HDW15A]|uniref:cysteine desulfurase family protein n=1 Tax=Sphingomonas sp. HDW15A TaxID=2714942 RepID=UPI00140BE0BB|nr:aminotransferase class V-fold PLP-dependent enzyme [Sphingomonas sp. HDW15A]QIK96083.1 aminotransferase class V-fold PLP-dependent enzyme [Sphingomonas sp. HDW15A]
MTTRIYLDHAATTPVIKEAREAFQRGLDTPGNPNSPHGEGRAARALLEEARETIKEGLGWRHDVIFTSGASEAVEIAGKRACVLGRAYGATEHAIVPFAMGDEATVIPVHGNGLIDEQALADILAQGPALVAIQQVNNETGIVQPLDRLYPMIRESGSLLLADCAQGASKMPLPDADFIAICGHKLGGPLGVGALLVKDLRALTPCGGGQEKGYRRGTQDVPGAISFAAAIAAKPYDMARFAALRQKLEAGVMAAGGEIIGADAPRAPTIGAIGLRGGTSAAMLIRLDLAGIAVSAGSACSSGKAKASHVLAAMKVEPELSSSYLRISFGPETSEADVDAFLREFERIASRNRSEQAA